MTTTESTRQMDQKHDRDQDRELMRELVRAITDTLVFALGKRAAHQTLRHPRANSGHTAQHKAIRAAAHLAGYSALLGYIWHQRRTHHSAA